MAQTRRQNNPLGRLASFGLTAPWQVALLLPCGWDDLTHTLDRFNQPVFEGDRYVVRGRLVRNPEARFRGTPRLVGCLEDDYGHRLGFVSFGDSRDLQKQLEVAGDIPVALFGTIGRFNDRPQLSNVELISSAWLGRLRPRYPGKTRVINPETVRQRVFQYLREAVQTAAEWLAAELAEFGNPSELAVIAGCPEWTLEDMLRQAHLPRELEGGIKAQKGLETLASLGIIRAAKGNRSSRKVAPLKLGDWRRRAQAIPFDLTDEQQKAVKDILTDMRSGIPMRRVLAGDVGTGKTAVYGLAVASVVDGQGRAILLMPNQPLASQVAEELRAWWPDIEVELVTRESQQPNLFAPVLVGTTALLFQRGPLSADLIVVDEQQKMGREQREQLLGPKTHLLEVTATCIPRTMALMRYGVLQISQLRENHTPKTIHTKIWTADEKRELFANIRSTLAAGKQVLVVYPLREEKEEENQRGEETEKPRLFSVEEAYRDWSRLFSGEGVHCIHGEMSDSDKDAVLDDMRQNRASILLATTVVEVGINIPNLVRGVVVNPERFGLSTLHQIRGRLARLGGEGFFDLYLPNPVKQATMERLQVLEKTTDGFKVAEYDMLLRGVGDLGSDSSKQSGSDETFLFGRAVRVDLLDRTLKTIEKREEK